MNTDVLLVMPSVSSYQTFFMDLPARAAEAGLRIHLAAGPPFHGQEAAPGGALSGRCALPEIRSGGGIAAARAVIALRRFIAELRPRVVHSHFAVAAVVAAATRYIAPQADAATWLATFHGLSGGASVVGNRSRVGKWEVWAARRHDRAYVLNQEDADHLHRLAPTLDVRLSAVSLGCDLARFSPSRFSADDRLAIKNQLGIPSAAPVVVFVGRQASFKGFATVVRAFWGICERVQECRLLLVGGRDPVHPVGLDADEIQRMTSDPSIIACGWQADVSPLLAVSDVCLFPSEREGMPVCLMEALSMGVPCVTSHSRGCRDIVRHETDGYVVRSGDPADYAAAVCRILASSVVSDSMRRCALAGRIRFDRRAFLDDQVRQYVEVVRNTTRQRHGG